PRTDVGRKLHFGIREHTMGAASNGQALSQLRSNASTFLIFSDYAKPAMRLSALMGVPALFIFTHDSIGLGEDGPTHQAIEQLAALRAMPNIVVLRPADANEVVEVYKIAMQLKHEPAAIVLTRQAIPTIDRTKYAPASGTAKGAYILADTPDGKPRALLLATGSELYFCLQAYEQLAKEGVAVRVVSMPSWEIFRRQTQAYRDSVLPPNVKARVAVEAASPLGWNEFIGMEGAMIGMRTFGASGPGKDVQKHFGFTPENIVAAVKAQIAGK
ncbi:MAG: transketolase-like TK C-terminal-containing protein, partial [Candidatus Acidiferrales bacterium]